MTGLDHWKIFFFKDYEEQGTAYSIFDPQQSQRNMKASGSMGIVVCEFFMIRLILDLTLESKKRKHGTRS